MIGETIQHYRILRQLGAGGMGVVYEAEDTRLGRHVALKFLPESLNFSREAGERFEREARVASSLNHPNICTIHDIGIHAGHRFMVMELLEGDSLRHRIHGSPLPIDQVIDVGCQIASALDAAHAKGIVHRDVKPANILITKRGQAKLLDFGVAKAGVDDADHSGDETRMSAEALTSPGTAVGSVNYMSPEQARGEQLDGRTDLFSLGLVLYEMATGRQAFAGQTTAVVFDAILNRDPQPIHELNADVPEELARVVNRALEKDRKLRYQTAADLEAELTRIRRDGSGRATAATMVASRAVTSAPTLPPTPARQSRNLRPAVFGIPIALIAAVGAFWFWNSTRTPAFTERDLIVISDFTNTTGDAVFDDALKQAVSVQLQQTPYVTLVGDPQVQRTLRLMQRKPDEKVVGAVAREVCQRSGAKATIDGSIAPIGSSYVLTLAVRNCQTGESMAQQQAQASSKETVLKTLGTSVTDLRKHLGESLASVAKYDAPAEASTASLDALQSYGLGVKTRVTKGDEAALPFFRQAVERDPNFALAYAKLSVIQSNLGGKYDARPDGQKAYDLRDRVSEYERLYIIWNYASHVTHDDKLTGDTLELMVAQYPRDYSARNNLGVFDMARGRFTDALKQYQIAIEISPNDPLPYGNATTTLFAMNKLPEALDMAAKSMSMRPDPGMAVQCWTLASVSGSPRAAEFETLARKTVPPGRVAAADGALAAWAGRIADAQRFYEASISSARSDGETGPALQNEVQLAFTLAAARSGAALTALHKYLAPSQPIYLVAPTAAVAGALGDLAAVRSVAPRLIKDVADKGPSHVEAAMALAMLTAAGGHADEAVASLEGILADSQRIQELHFHIARILDAAGRSDDAAKHYRALIDARISLGTSLTIPMSRLYLGNILAAKGDTAGAKEQFDLLGAQWKNADADFGPANQLKAAIAKLPK